jgi:hypothetical protein
MDLLQLTPKPDKIKLKTKSKSANGAKMVKLFDIKEYLVMQFCQNF